MSISFWSSLSFDSFGWCLMLWSKFFYFCISSCSQQESEMSLLLGSFSWLEVETPERTGWDTFVRWFLLLIFLLRDFFIQWNVLCLVPQSCPTPCDPRDCSPPGSSAHGDSPGKNIGVGYYTLLYSILAWVAISSSKGSSCIRNWTCISYISCTGRYILYKWCHLGSPINVNHIGIIYQIILKEEWMNNQYLTISSVQFSHSVVSDSLQPCGQQHTSFLVHHQLLELGKTHVHWVGNAIQPSHLLSSPSPPAFNLSQHQGLFKWVRSSHQVAKVLEFQLLHQSFQWTLRTDLLAVQGTLKSPWVQRVQKHEFFGTQLSLRSNPHSHTWLLEKPQLGLDGPLLTK